KQQRGGDHDKRADAPAQDRERQRIAARDEIARHRGGRAAKRARHDRDQHADDFGHVFSLRMIWSENRFPLFGIMRFMPCSSPPSRRHLPGRYSLSNESFAARLRSWRERRGFSQLALAGHAGISQRHLSFLELSRAAPSREMVIRLASALDLPLRQQNALL